MTTKSFDPGEAAITGQEILRHVDGAELQFTAIAVANRGRYAGIRWRQTFDDGPLASQRRTGRADETHP